MEAVTAPARLLVVDDEATSLELLSGSLRLAGFEVMTAASGTGAVLKRTRADAPRSRLRVAGLELDEDAHEVKRDGVLVALAPTEYRLLRFLMANAGRVVSKGEILGHLWEHDPDHGAGRDGNAVEPVLSCLRRKVDQGEPRLIHTVRGFGYVLRIPPP